MLRSPQLHHELIAKLDSFTNLRAVRDEESATGWTLEIGPFPGAVLVTGDRVLIDAAPEGVSVIGPRGFAELTGMKPVF
jgi:hypothetical protein